MDIQKWATCEWASEEQYQEFAGEMTAYLEEQIAGADYSLLKVLPNNWIFSAVVGSESINKWINVNTGDVRESADWASAIKLRRMSSERDWKGEEFHFCSLEELGASIAKYMGDEYDDEIL